MIEHPNILYIVRLYNLPAPLEWFCPTTSGAAPSPRQGHILAVVGNKLFVHGGMAGQEIFNDLHTLDLGELLASFPGPVQLFVHIASYQKLYSGLKLLVMKSCVRVG